MNRRIFISALAVAACFAAGYFIGRAWNAQRMERNAAVQGQAAPPLP